MRIPKTAALSTARETVTALGGYDHRPVIAAGSWYDQENVTADLYPTAAVRKKHGTKALEGGEGPVTGIFETNGRIGYTRFVASGTPAADHGTVTFYDAGGTRRNVDLGLNFELKKFVRMGAYIIILPDLKWINTADITTNPEHGSLAEVKYDITDSQSAITVTPVDDSGNALVYTASGTEPAAPALGDLWYSTRTRELLQYFTNGWMPFAGETYVKLSWDSLTADAFNFEAGLYIKIDVAVFYGTLTGTKLKDGYYKLIEAGASDGHPYIIIEHPFLAGTASAYDTIELSWGLPKMNYMIESGNRLWGCYYGKSTQIIEGVNRVVTVNEIYASALGSFKEWHRFDGSDADSYVASVGSDGPFTGAVSYQGRPTFFKERCVHVVYGSYPSAYQTISTECHGIESGSDRSAALVDNVLYYKSPEGFAAYDGSLPVLFGAELGDVKYKKVSAGGYDRKYFASAVDEDGKAHVLIYDTRLGLWQHAESRDYSTASLAVTTLFSEAEDDMCFIDAADSFATVRTWFGSGTKDSGAVEWYAETGDLGLGDLYAKYVILIAIRMRLAVGSRLRVKIRYDDGPWEHVSDRDGHSLAKFTLPIRVRRCDHFRIRLEGVGDAQLYAIERTIQGGSRK